MRALVIFESMFGNTRTIATAVAQGLATSIDSVDLVEVGAADKHVEGVDLIVIGGPTHAFGMSRSRTREDARRQADAATVSAGPGIREWLGEARIVGGPAVATFDTRVDRPRVPGSAAAGAARMLRRTAKLRVIRRPESFYVGGVQGPLCDGEATRAREWGQRLGLAVTSERPKV